MKLTVNELKLAHTKILNPYLTIKEVAELCGIGPEQVYRVFRRSHVIDYLSDSSRIIAREVAKIAARLHTKEIEAAHNALNYLVNVINGGVEDATTKDRLQAAQTVLEMVGKALYNAEEQG